MSRWLILLLVLAPARTAAGYAGAAACRPCHAAIYAQQSASEHANALAAAPIPKPTSKKA